MTKVRWDLFQIQIIAYSERSIILDWIGCVFNINIIIVSFIYTIRYRKKMLILLLFHNLKYV